MSKWWGRSDKWIAADFGLSHVSIKNYREAQGVKILTPLQLNLTQDQRVALETEILKRERVSKDGKDGEDGQVQPVTCKTAVTAFVEMVEKK